MPELDLQKDINRAIELLKSLQNNPSLPRLVFFPHYFQTLTQTFSDKLKSLQEVLESDFLYSITNVYQSIYDTVDLTHSSKESAAIATAKGIFEFSSVLVVQKF